MKKETVLGLLGIILLITLFNLDLSGGEIDHDAHAYNIFCLLTVGMWLLYSVLYFFFLAVLGENKKYMAQAAVVGFALFVWTSTIHHYDNALAFVSSWRQAIGVLIIIVVIALQMIGIYLGRMTRFFRLLLLTLLVIAIPLTIALPFIIGFSIPSTVLKWYLLTYFLLSLTCVWVYDFAAGDNNSPMAILVAQLLLYFHAFGMVLIGFLMVWKSVLEDLK